MKKNGIIRTLLDWSRNQFNHNWKRFVNSTERKKHDFQWKHNRFHSRLLKSRDGRESKKIEKNARCSSDVEANAKWLECKTIQLFEWHCYSIRLSALDIIQSVEKWERKKKRPINYFVFFNRTLKRRQIPFLICWKSK